MTKGMVSSRVLSSLRLVIRNHGKPETALELDKFDINFNLNLKRSVLLSLVAAPVNFADINYIQGVYPVGQVTLPTTVGFEGVFRVVDVGNEVTELKAGDLAYLPNNFMGTWTKNLVAQEDQLSKIPNVFKNPIDSATFKVNPFTAYRILEDFETLSEGDVIVQNGSTSHVGQAIIQMAKARGIITINIIKPSVYQEQARKDLMLLGGNYVVTEDEARNKAFVDIVGSSTPKAKLALNIVGDKSVYNLVKMTKDNGTVVTIGGVSMRPLAVPTSSLVFHNHKYVGFWVNKWIANNFKSPLYAKMEKEVLEYYQQGVLQGPLYTKTLEISDYKKVFVSRDDSQPSKRYIFV